MGFRKADDFYVALGQGKISPKTVANKVFQRLKQGEAVAGDRDRGRPRRASSRAATSASAAHRGRSDYGIEVKGVDDVMVRLAKCCRPVPGDEIVGYVSLGRGITIHREDCKNVAALKKAPERFTEVAWDGDNATSYRVELQVDALDRTRLLEDLSRTFAEAGVNILEANVHRPSTRWSRTASWSRSATPSSSSSASAACATSSPSSTPTASRRRE